MLGRNSVRQQLATLKRVDARLWGFLAISMLSLMFQLMLSTYEGGNRATTPDTPRYIRVATNLQDALHGAGKLDGDVLRTPGYPLLILIAAESAGINLSDVELPVRNWKQTNKEGKQLVRRIIVLQEILGFAIPLTVYAIALSMGGCVLLSIVVSICYFTDIRSVAFQYVVLNETQSIFLMLLTLLTFISALKRRSIGWIALCGVVTSLTVLVRPPLVILPVILCRAAYLTLRYDGASLKISASWVARYIAIVALFPILWSFVNFQNTGHFFFTKNAMTLQNFAARHFVQLEIEDPELLVLQRHARHQLDDAHELNLRDFEIYAFDNAFDAVANELAIDDRMDLYSLAERATRITIKEYPAAFLGGGVRRWTMAWFKPFGNIKNAYARDRVAEFGLPGKFLAHYGYMLFGPGTLFCLLLLIPSALRTPFQSRILFVSLFAFVIIYSMAVTLADENEPIRHTMQIRILVNGMLMAACLIIVSNSAYWRQLFSRRIVRGVE